MIKVRKLVSAFLTIKNNAADSMFDNFEYDGTLYSIRWKTQCAKDKIRYTIASHYLGVISSLNADASISYINAMEPLFDMQLSGIKRLLFPSDFNLEYNKRDFNAVRNLNWLITVAYLDMYKTIESLDDEKE